jgi:hypothetical protein
MTFPFYCLPLQNAALLNNPALVAALVDAQADTAKRTTSAWWVHATARDIAKKFGRHASLALLDACDEP